MMDNIKLDIPTSWDDITIGQFVELQPVLKSDMGLIKKVNSVLSVLTGNPVDDLENVAASENNIRAYRDISNTLSFMNDYTNMGEVVSTFDLLQFLWFYTYDIYSRQRLLLVWEYYSW